MTQLGLYGTREERRLDLSQWYTPPPLARAIWEWAGGESAQRILEPSAGHGSLIQPSSDVTKWVAYDVDPNNVTRLLESFPGLEVRARDWMMDPDPGRFDLSIMNPPYEGDQDMEHVLKAIDHCDRVVALLRSAYDHSESRWEEFWRWVVPTREVALALRPSFGGSGSPKSDFKVFEFAGGILDVPRAYGEPVTITKEVWRGSEPSARRRRR